MREELMLGSASSFAQTCLRSLADRQQGSESIDPEANFVKYFFLRELAAFNNSRKAALTLVPF
jgi:hypothetical protein